LRRNQIKADTQREMILGLSQIFKSTDYSQEALALRVFQALEAAATDPVTHPLLPEEAVRMLRELGFWLLPEGYAATPIFNPKLGGGEEAGSTDK
jgi:hypothetical protein